MIVECKNISKVFGTDVILDDFSYSFEQGKIYVLYGVSGSGKSTLLNLIGNLDKPSSGEIVYYKDSKVDTSNQMMLFRKRIAYLFQNYALIDDKTVKYNLEIALEYIKSDSKEKLMEDALERVGLNGYLNKKVFTLSGGEQQRVALARVLLKENDVVLADEPTGNLDEKNVLEVVELFKELKNKGKTIIIATHDESFLDICDYKIVLEKNH